MRSILPLSDEAIYEVNYKYSIESSINSILEVVNYDKEASILEFRDYDKSKIAIYKKYANKTKTT